MSDHQTIFDADNHYYEPRDAFTRYMDPRRREAAISKVVRSERLGHRRGTFISRVARSRTNRSRSIAAANRNYLDPVTRMQDSPLARKPRASRCLPLLTYHPP